MYYILYFILILLTIYSDSPLQLQLGYFGKTFIPVIAFPIYFLIRANNALPVGDVFLDKYKKLLKYTIGISVAALVVCVFLDVDMNQLGEFLPNKMIKLILIYFSYWIYVKVLINIAYRLNIRQIFQPFFICLILITIIAYIEVYIGEFVFNSIHYGDALDRDWDYNRVRLLCSESSFTAPLIEIFLGFSLYYAYVIRKSNIFKIITYACGGLLLFTTGSKTLMLAIGIALLYTFIILNKGKYNSKKILWICVFVVLAYIMYTYLMPILHSKFITDIQENTSTVTRSYTVLMGYIIGTLSVVGTGFQSYLAFFPDALNEGLGLVNIYMKDANLSEIASYIMATSGQNIGAKSFFAQSSMFWGIFGTIFFVKSYWKVFSEIVFKRILEKVFLGTVNIVILFQLFFSADMDYIVLAMISVFIILKQKEVIAKS